MSNELVKQNEIELQTRPRDVVVKATEAAKELQRIVNNRSKKLVLAGKQYLFFEDWQTLGKFDQITAKVISTEEIHQEGKLFGFNARAVALKDGMEISAAEAECCFDEPNWKNKPRFQLKSMAQTRACAKALRNCLAFIAVLANYEPTPAEEMEDNDNKQNNQNPATKKQINYIREKMINSSKSTIEEKKEWNKLITNGITFEEASKKRGWWLGDSKKNIEGERSKREKGDKVKEDKATGKGKTDLLLEEIARLRHENFLNNDTDFYKALSLNKKLEEHTEKELTIILGKLKGYVPDMSISDEDIPE